MENRSKLVDSEFYSVKVKFILACLSIIFIVIAIRLFHLQVMQTEEFQKASLDSRKQVITLPSYRGEIFVDDGAKAIVENEPSFSIYLIPENFFKNYPRKERPKQIERYAESFGISSKRIEQALKKGRVNPYLSYLLKEQVEREQIFQLAERLEDFPGLIYGGDYQRNYTEGEKYAHITGYIRPISSKEYKKRKEFGYNLLSQIGKQGIEGYYDIDLRGREGYRMQVVDIKNRVKQEFQPEDGDPLPGRDMVLTIDSKVQDVIHRMMQGYPGGAVVTKVSTGEILGMYSYPSYDPNIFIGNLNVDEFEKNRDDPDRPFYNRVIQGEYPPSSIYKLVLTLIALETPVVDLNNFYTVCYGGMRIGPTFFGCEAVHNYTTYSSALAQSCNVFFYKLGLKLGPKVISKFSKNFFSMGTKTGVDLLYERPGFVPSQRWKVENRGVFWWDGDTANFSIGQGFLTSTILQINTITAAIAGDGSGYRPYLMKRSISKQNPEDVYEKTPEIFLEMPFSKENIEKVQRAMWSVVEWGTGRRARSSRVAVAGKTGTAQIEKSKEPHSWFTAYAPYNAPIEDRVAITVFLEFAGHGGEMAAPFAVSILEGIFADVDPRLAFKEKLQVWKTKQQRYETWLQKTGEQRLPDEYFLKSKKNKI